MRGTDVLATAVCALLFKVCRQPSPPPFCEVVVCCRSEDRNNLFSSYSRNTWFSEVMSTVPTDLPETTCFMATLLFDHISIVKLLLISPSFRQCINAALQRWTKQWVIETVTRKGSQSHSLQYSWTLLTVLHCCQFFCVLASELCGFKALPYYM